MSSTLTPAAIASAVRKAGGNPDLSVRVTKADDGTYTVTIPARWSARYLHVHPEAVHLGRAAVLLSEALGFGVWVTEVRPGARRAGTAPAVKFDVSLAR